MAFLDTVGLEIEGGGFSKEYTAQVLSKKFENWREYFNIGRDASVESTVKHLSPTLSVFGHDSISQRCDAPYDRETYGYEITTTPLDFKTAEKVIHTILNTLIAHGEVVSPRASTHIHVGFADSYQLLHNAFIMGLWLEPLFFKIAGMGNKFRGYSNSSIYCRPLELSVGVLGQDNNWYSLLDSDSTMSTDDATKIWMHYGINIRAYKMHPERYHPARYFGMNLLSMPLHGTLEFRFFNSCFDSSYVLAVTRLCQATTELMTKMSRTFVDQLNSSMQRKRRKSIVENWSNDEFHTLLDKLEYYFDRYDLTFNTEPQHRRILRTIIENTPTPTFSNELPKSHIKNYVLPIDAIVTGFHKKVQNVVESGFTDIHNIGNQYYASISSED